MPSTTDKVRQYTGENVCCCEIQSDPRESENIVDSLNDEDYNLYKIYFKVCRGIKNEVLCGKSWKKDRYF